MRNRIDLDTGRRLARAASVAALSAVLLAGTPSAVTPAYAAGNCTESHRELPTPGYDVDLWVKICATGSTGQRSGAYMIVSWRDAGGGATDGDRTFDGLRMYLRVERYDVIYAGHSWSLAGKLNRTVSGSWTSPIVWADSTKRGGWTGDGKVEYDIDRDGEGYQDAWQLHGSPMQY